LCGRRGEQTLARLQPFDRCVVVRVGEPRARLARQRRFPVFVVPIPGDRLDAVKRGLFGAERRVQVRPAKPLPEVGA
jgi:hypothetical protein